MTARVWFESCGKVELYELLRVEKGLYLYTYVWYTYNNCAVTLYTYLTTVVASLGSEGCYVSNISNSRKLRTLANALLIN